jgi:NAD-dependent dihydropyrimidine dehydrogenase PreA subunit
MGVEKQDRGLLRVDGDECKGCGLCVEACPPKVIALNDRLNHYGYRTATYAGAGCTACGICFLVCPEPGAITVLRRRNRMAALSPVEGAAQIVGAERSVEGATECASN